MEIVPFDTNSSDSTTEFSLFFNRVEDVAFIIQMILGTVGILGNSLVCVTIARARFMHNVTNVFIAHMAMADVLVCMSLLIFQDRHFRDFPGAGSFIRNEIRCKVYKGQAMLWFTSDLSIYSMLGVTVERFVAIVRPLRYPRFYKRSNVVIMISLTWFLAALVQTPSLFIFSSYNSFKMKCSDKSVSRNGIVAFFVAGSLSFLLPAVVLFWCYIRILISLRESAVSQRRENNHAHANELFMVGRRVVKVLLTVSVLYVCIWFPVHVLFTVVNFKTGLSPEAEVVLRALQPTLAVLNSVVNPFVYAFKYKEFQRGVRECVFPFCCYRQRAHVAPS